MSTGLYILSIVFVVILYIGLFIIGGHIVFDRFKNLDERQREYWNGLKYEHLPDKTDSVAYNWRYLTVFMLTLKNKGLYDQFIVHMMISRHEESFRRFSTLNKTKKWEVKNLFDLLKIPVLKTTKFSTFRPEDLFNLNSVLYKQFDEEYQSFLSEMNCDFTELPSYTEIMACFYLFHDRLYKNGFDIKKFPMQYALLQFCTVCRYNPLSSHLSYFLQNDNSLVIPPTVRRYISTIVLYPNTQGDKERHDAFYIEKATTNELMGKIHHVSDLFRVVDASNLYETKGYKTQFMREKKIFILLFNEIMGHQMTEGEIPPSPTTDEFNVLHPLYALNVFMESYKCAAKVFAVRDRNLDVLDLVIYCSVIKDLDQYGFLKKILIDTYNKYRNFPSGELVSGNNVVTFTTGTVGYEQKLEMCKVNDLLKVHIDLIRKSEWFKYTSFEKDIEGATYFLRHCCIDNEAYENMAMLFKGHLYFRDINREQKKFCIELFEENYPKKIWGY